MGSRGGVVGTIQPHRLLSWQKAEGDQDDRQIKEEVRDDHEDEVAPPHVETGFDRAQRRHDANDVAQIPSLQVEPNQGSQRQQSSGPSFADAACQTLDRVCPEEQFFVTLAVSTRIRSNQAGALLATLPNCAAIGWRDEPVHGPRSIGGQRRREEGRARLPAAPLATRSGERRARSRVSVPTSDE